MAFRSFVSATVTNTATKVFEAVAGDLEVWLTPLGTCSIGGADVSPSTGFPRNSGQIFEAEVRPGDEIYAIVSSGSMTFRVLVRSA